MGSQLTDSMTRTYLPEWRSFRRVRSRWGTLWMASFKPLDLPDRGASKARAYPVVADGRLSIRDIGTLWCYDVKAGRRTQREHVGAGIEILPPPPPDCLA